MKHTAWFSLFPVATLGCLIPLTVKAQVTTDGTTSTTVNQDGNNFTIEQGDRINDNLFHSFNEFSVPTLGSAVFNNAGDIANIFSRVTGSSISSIDGLLSANGAANLYLINPNGIIFGPNARLDLGGSFFASTADSLLFEGNAEFSAVNPQAPPLLEVSIPIGLNFRDNPAPINIEKQPPGSADFPDLNPDVTFDDNLFGLRVPDGKTFALAGGDIIADGGGIVAVGGRIDLGAVGESGTLGVILENDNISFNFPDDLARANVSLTNGAGFLVSGSGGGDIAITANNIEILEGSGLFAGIFEGFQVPDSQGGDINLNASETIRIASSISDASEITNQVGNFQLGDLFIGLTTQGNAGNIILNSNTVEGSGNFFIRSLTSGTGNAGQININAQESVLLEGNEGGNNGVSSIVGASAIGNGGDVTISTFALSIFNSSLLLSTIGNGDTGNILIEANDSIQVSGISQFQSTGFGNGNAGNILIDAPNAEITFENPTTLVGTSVAALAPFLETSPELLVLVDSLGIPRISSGSSGDITVTRRTLSISDGARFVTSTAGQATNDDLANAGDINIDVSDSFVLSGNSQLLSNTAGQGNAGDVNITAGGQVSLEGNENGTSTSIRTTVELLPDALAEDFTEVRQGGDINVTANSVSLTNGSQVLSNAISDGDAGDIKIVSNNIEIDGGDNGILTGLFAQVAENATGQGGNINLGSEQSPITKLSLSNRGQISVSTFGQGDAGNLSIFSNNIEFDGGVDSLLTGLFASVESGATGTGGDINLGNEQFSIQQLILNNGAQITANTFSEGDAGNLSIFANNIDINGIGDFPSGLFAEVGQAEEAEFGKKVTGNGGNINLGSEQSPIEQLNLNSGAEISVDTFGQGEAGSLSIFSNNIKLNGDGLLTGFFASVESEATGQGGNIFIETDSLTLTDGGRVAANVEIMGEGDAGTLEIFVSDSILVDGTTSEGAPSAITSVVNGEQGNEERKGIGNGGDVTISTGSLSLINGGRVSATSLGQGDGRDLTINASESIFISGFAERFRSGISVDALINDGNSGNANITTNQLTIEDGGTIEASNIDTLGVFTSGTGEPGNISIQANSITLNNGGRIDAVTQSEIGDNANINLVIAEDIILRNNSLISATALENADGGNVTINANDGFILAFTNQNNDIVANAAKGNGGNIEIFSQAIFGLEERSSTPANLTNDIDASSEFGLQGSFSRNTPEIDPTSGLIELPEVVGDASDQISQNPCEQGVGSEFTITGKGGLAPNPNETLSSDKIRVGLVEPVPSRQGGGQTEIIGADNNHAASSEQLVPAQGWVFNEKGEVTLTAYQTINQRVQRSGQTNTNSCPTR